MQFKKSLMFFSVFALAVLALSLSSARTTQDTCLTISPVSVPSTVLNTQGTFQATFNIGFGSASCNPRTINVLSLRTILNGATSSTGSWSISNTLPINIDTNLNNPTLITAAYSIPASGTGTLLTEITLNANSTATNNLTYTFALPNISLTQPTPTASNLTITVNSPTPILIGQNATITLSNSGTTPISGISITEVSSPIFGAVFNPSSAISLAGAGTLGSSQVVNVLLNSLTGLKFGTNNLVVRAQTASPPAVSAQVTIPIRKTFCSRGSIGSNLSIKSVDIENDGEGDEDTWELLDEVTVEIEVENNNNDNDIDARIVMGLFDSSGSDIANDLDFSSDSDGDEEEIDINIDDGDEETVQFVFKVPTDFDSGNHKLAIKVLDEDAGETVECKDNVPGFSDGFFEAINIERTNEDEKAVIVDSISFDTTPAACSELVTGTFEVANVGTDDQDRVRITMRNSELGLDEVFEIEDLDEGDDSETVSFSFRVPVNAQNKQYRIDFRTEYGYDDGIFEDESEDAFNGFLEVAGCSGTGQVPIGTTPNVLITASLESDAKAGEELVVEATITNTGSTPAAFTISVDNYNDWASLDDISETSLTLNAGESETVTLTFTVDEDASGAQTFDIQASSGSAVKTQEVEVNIEDSADGFNFNFGDNKSLIWIIVIVNIILIILIVVVAVRVARR